jgi:hypothetical protein
VMSENNSSPIIALGWVLYKCLVAVFLVASAALILGMFD